MLVIVEDDSILLDYLVYLIGIKVLDVNLFVNLMGIVDLVRIFLDFSKLRREKLAVFAIPFSYGVMVRNMPRLGSVV